jgi:hypothetical protein
MFRRYKPRALLTGPCPVHSDQFSIRERDGTTEKGLMIASAAIAHDSLSA